MAKNILLLISCMLAAIAVKAQTDGPFRAYIYNNEYQVYMGQELYGNLPGFLGKQLNSFCWVITSCKIESDKQAELQLINDFGSEDLKATLTCVDDSTYVLRQGSGSTLKVPHQGKWRKLPKTIEFKRKLKN